jgi:hypothetical protein
MKREKPKGEFHNLENGEEIGMNLFERLYDESEKARVRFVGFVSEHGRFDFGIVYTRMFFGKPLVICMQTGRSSLFSAEDVENYDYLQKVFNLTKEEAEDVSVFLKTNLPAVMHEMEAEN